MFTERSLGCLGVGMGRSSTALSVGAPSPGQDGDRATLPWTPLSLFFSGDTAAGPRDCRKMRRPKPSASSSPPEPFWLTFSFPFFLGGGVGEREGSLFLTLHSSLWWDGRLLLTRSQGQREGARGSWRLLWCVLCVRYLSDPLQTGLCLSLGAVTSTAPSAERSTLSPIPGL